MKLSNFSLILVTFSAISVGPAAEVRAAANPPASASNAAAGCALQVHVDGLRNSSGVVGVAIFGSAEGWPEDTSKALHAWATSITPGAHDATAAWENLRPGDYSVVVLHDENKNRKLDRNLIGIPKEGFGFTNNPPVKLSAPPYETAIVHVACPVTETTIHMIYK